jgi:hypothetical protein
MPGQTGVKESEETTVLDEANQGIVDYAAKEEAEADALLAQANETPEETEIREAEEAKAEKGKAKEEPGKPEEEEVPEEKVAKKPDEEEDLTKDLKVENAEKRIKAAQSKMHDSNKRAKTAEDEAAKIKQENADLRALVEKAATGAPAPKAKEEEEKKPAPEPDEVEASLESLRQEYPEIAEPMIKMMAKQEAENKELRDTLNEIKSKEEEREKTATEEKDNIHYNTIAAVHKDIDEILEEPLLDEWIDSLPAIEKAGALAIQDKGSAKDVIALITSFKEANGYEVPAPPPEKKGDSKLDKAKRLTNPTFKKAQDRKVQSGYTPHFTVAEIDAMSPQEYAKNEEKIDEDLANRRLY